MLVEKLAIGIHDIHILMTILEAKSYLEDFHLKCRAHLMEMGEYCSKSYGCGGKLCSKMKLTSRLIGFVKRILNPLLESGNTM